MAHNGRRLVAFVALPAWYRPDSNPPIPLVIAPHGRGTSPKAIVDRFGKLPAVGGFAVVSPEGHGRRVRRFSWGYRGQIDDLARMPAHLARALPWLEIDRSRVYAFGASMGGQEALLLAVRHPRLLAGVAAFDAIADLALQFRNFPRIACNSTCNRRWGRHLGQQLRRLARLEVGGTPATAPGAYAARSPLACARKLAFSDVPVQLWWTRKDRTVMQPQRQSGALFRRLNELNPWMHVEGFVGEWAHAKVMRSKTGLRRALARFDLVANEEIERGSRAGRSD